MENFKVKLTKLSDNKNNLRTNEIIGECFDLPTEGKCFTLFGEGIEFGTRVVQTSLVQSVERTDNVVRFKTLNSSYQLDIFYS